MHISLIYAKQAYELFEKEKAQTEIINALLSMILQYIYNQNFEAAEHALQAAYDKLDQKPEEKNKSVLFMLEYYSGRLDEAKGEEEIALQKYTVLTDTKEEHSSLVYVYKSMVDLYFKQKNWMKVEKYIERAMTLAEKYQINYVYIQLIEVRANLMLIRHDEIGYEKEMKRALTLAKEAAMGKLVKEIAQTLGNYYMEQRFYKKASEYYKAALLASK